MEDRNLTEQQRKWIASVRAGLETATGRSLAQWLEIARACPEATPRARQRWLKEQHGLGQNHAMLVLNTLAEETGGGRRAPEELAAALWSDPGAAAILAALRAAIDRLPQAISGQRKGYTSWSRNFAFAAARPARGGRVRLGLAVPPETDAALSPATAREGWSERLKAAVELSDPAEVDDRLRALLHTAWERS